MAFDRPTLTEIKDRSQNDLVSRLGGAGTPTRRSVVGVLARVVAGAVHMLHGHLEYLARQLFPDISETTYLERHASLYAITRQAATYATGSVTVTGADSTLIPEGTILRRADGAEYEVTADTTISGASEDVPVSAVLAGADGNADSGTVLTFESPITDVDAEATVTAAHLTGGADTETDAALRTRLLTRLQSPPEGGAESDYENWALAVAGVTRVWVYPQADGAGTVTVRFMRDDDAGDPFPSAGEVTTVQDYIDERRPVTAAVTVEAPVAKTWAFTIAVVPDTTAVREAVEAELEDLFQREGVPGETLELSKVRTAIGIADGLDDYTLTTPAVDLTHAAGELPVVGTITWT